MCKEVGQTQAFALQFYVWTGDDPGLRAELFGELRHAEIVKKRVTKLRSDFGQWHDDKGMTQKIAERLFVEEQNVNVDRAGSKFIRRAHSAKRLFDRSDHLFFEPLHIQWGPGEGTSI